MFKVVYFFFFWKQNDNTWKEGDLLSNQHELNLDREERISVEYLSPFSLMTFLSVDMAAGEFASFYIVMPL